MNSDKSVTINQSKRTFLYIFLVAVVVLLLLPFITTFNDVLTRLVMRMDFYRVIQDFIVPWEVRMVGVILLPFGFQPEIFGDYLALKGDSSPFLLEITWNCIGWQSLLFFILTAWVGLQGDRYTTTSKLKAWAIGFLGTFLVNIFRIAVVSVIAYYFGQNVAIIFHDYGSTLAVLGWLAFFWWFSYAYVLEEKRVKESLLSRRKVAIATVLVLVGFLVARPYLLGDVQDIKSPIASEKRERVISEEKTEVGIVQVAWAQESGREVLLRFSGEDPPSGGWRIDNPQNAIPAEGKAGRAYKVEKNKPITLKDGRAVASTGTLSFWLQIDGELSTNERSIIAWNLLDKENQESLFEVSLVDDQIYFSVYFDGGQFSIGDGKKINNLNAWHHIDVTWDFTDVPFAYDLYVDSTIVDEGEISDPMTPWDSARIEIGGDLFARESLEFLLDEVELVNWVKSEQEIASGNP